MRSNYGGVRGVTTYKLPLQLPPVTTHKKQDIICQSEIDDGAEFKNFNQTLR
ncbi:hypothetical protein N8772_04325 [Rickettsiales bacterium]|nr:hypothetical protein [Rickettsiales bacterium]